MEVNLKKLGEQEVESTTVSKKMRLSDDHASMVFQMFTKLIYSNPIGTVVREITSNCFDSHIEAKVNSPVLIKKSFDGETNTHYISFIDFGVGMSPDRVENIYGVYFESSKRSDNTQIGGFGIGGKTPLAYKRRTGLGEKEYDNSFEVHTIFNSVKYHYLVFEGKEAPEFTLQYEEPTTEHNGTEIRISVLEKDIETFAKEMVRQLYYFENVVFEGFDDTYKADTLTNEYQIVRGKSFFFRGNEYSEYMHVCLGRVAYPIDFNVLNLNSSDYRLPIAVKLEIGDIGVNLSREQLDYSEITINVLKKKLEIAKAEIKDLIAKQYLNVQSLEDYFNVKLNFGKLNFSNGSSINVGNIIKQADVDFSNFRYSFMKMPNDKQLYRFFFNSKTFGKKPRRSRYTTEYLFEGSYEAIQKNSNLLYIEADFIRKVVKQAYLKSLYEMYHIISKRNLCESSMRHEIAELFNVHLDKLVDDNGKPVTYVQSLLDMQEEYFQIIRSHAKDYDNVEIPEDFVLDRKRNAMSKEMRNTTIPVKFIGGHSKYRIKLENLFDYECPIFYGKQEDENRLYEAYNLFCVLFDQNAPVTFYSDYDKQFENRRSNGKANKKSIMFIVLAENNLKYMQYCKKAYTVDKFFSKILYRKENVVKQYFQTFGLVDRFKTIDELYTSKFFARVSPLWSADIADLTTKINAIPEKARETSIGNYQQELSKYFDLSDKKLTKDQMKIEKEIDNVLTLQAMNEKILEHINMPYRYDREAVSDELVAILQKVMIL